MIYFKQFKITKMDKKIILTHYERLTLISVVKEKLKKTDGRGQEMALVDILDKLNEKEVI